MSRTWTFGQKIGAGFAVMVLFCGVLAGAAVHALRTVAQAKDDVLATDARDLIAAGKLETATEAKSSAFRGYLVLRDDANLKAQSAAQADFQAAMRELRSRADEPTTTKFLDDIEASAAAHEAATNEIAELRRGDGTLESVVQAYQTRVLPARVALHSNVDAFVAHQQERLDARSKAATLRADDAVRSLIFGAIVALAIASAIAWLLARTLSRQIGTAVQRVQSSSAELQTAANQQASGAREQSSAITEITTTINELLATSKQIAESAKRVATIASETAKAAQTGETIAGKTGDSIGTIKLQVDLIVSQMLELGRKSQQIGGILEIINELAEQTNILAINATIEAAGAGDAGRRFGVVADEIRKLADRVASSTKEIRSLIDDVRGAVNATVMTTESGSKAVDAGTRQFADVAVALHQIVGAVNTTTEAAREIELSTKQQATAVEQVNIAIGNVAQATVETEASATQTLQTASELTGLSRELTRLVRPQVSASP